MRTLVLAIVSFLMCQQIVAQLAPIPLAATNFRYSLSACVLTVTSEFRADDIVTIALTTLDYQNYSTSMVQLDQLLLRVLHKQLKWSLLVTKSNLPEKDSKFFKKSDEYIIQIRDDNEFESILMSLMSKESWNPYGKFVIISTTLFLNPGDLVQYIFERFWREKVLNVVIMLPQLDNPFVLDIYSWFPFEYGNCGDSFSVAQIVNSCQTGQMRNAGLLFPEKVPLDMNGCEVRVRAIIGPPYIIAPDDFNQSRHYNTTVKFEKGIEILLVNTIAEVANFTVLYSVSKTSQNWGKVLQNGTVTGMMATLMTEQADIGIGALAPFDLKQSFFDPSEPYTRESVAWCIPHAQPVPRWKSILRIFHPLAWYIILVTYLVLTLAVWLVSRRDRAESTSYQSPQSCSQNTLSILLGIPVNTLPRIAKNRLMILAWIVACLHLNSAYTSSLMRELTRPTFEQPVDNISVLIAAGFRIGLVSPTHRFLRQDNRLDSMKPVVEMCPDVIACLDRTAYARDLAVGLPRMHMQYTAEKYINEKGHPMVYWMRKDIASYPVEMIMTKGFPLLNRINSLIFRVKEAGLISKWRKDFARKVPRSVPAQGSSDGDVILTKSHLEGVFIFLLLGLSFAAVVFIVETFLYRQKSLFSTCYK